LGEGRLSRDIGLGRFPLPIFVDILVSEFR
jgi:hypothetical protein